jgi:hypothetical protein
MNPYRMEYERQHGKKTPVGIYVFAGFVFALTIISVLVMVSRADVAPRIIYQQDDITGKTAEVGIAPGVNIYIPDCDEEPINDESSTQNEYSGITISDSEMEELKRIVAAEAQTQSLEGREAVVEVIFNRVLSDEWPDTVHGVLSQKGQFATWRMRNQSWVVPDAAVAAIEYVLENGRTVLPEGYVYFSRGRSKYGTDWIKLQDHWFGRMK